MRRDVLLQRLGSSVEILEYEGLGDATMTRVAQQLRTALDAEREEKFGFEKKIKTMHYNGSGAWMISNFFVALCEKYDMNYAAQAAQRSFAERYGKGGELPHIGGLMMAFHILGSTHIELARRALFTIGSRDSGIKALEILITALP